MNNEPIKITIQRSDDKKLELTTHWDSGLDDWSRIFRVILKWLSFTEKQIDGVFVYDEFGQDKL